MQPDGCLSEHRRRLPGAGRPQSPPAARQPERAQRADAARAVLGARHGSPVGEQAPRGAGGGQPRHDRPPRPGEAALPERGAHQRHQRALDHALRAAPRARARRPQTSTGGHPRAEALVRLHDEHQDHARAALAGADRAGLHRPLLGHGVPHRLEVGLALHAAPARRHRLRRRAGRRRVRPLPPARVHLAHDHAGMGRRAGRRRRHARPPRRRAALEGDVRHRAARRRAGQAHRRPRRPRARRPDDHDDQPGVAARAGQPQDAARDRRAAARPPDVGGDGLLMTHATGTREPWRAPRLELLEAEKELTRRGDEVARRRQELPWVRVEKDYRFETDAGSASLADLFGGRSQLLVYHFMLGPDYTAGCPSCSAIADGFEGSVVHLEQHDVGLMAVSRAPIDVIQAYKRRMGWTFPWASSSDSDFNFDFNTSLTEEQQRSEGGEYNYRSVDSSWLDHVDPDSGVAQFAAMTGTDVATYTRERPGMSAFALEDGVVHHTYSSFARGLDGLWGMYQWLDRAPKGRNETGIWFRRHDEYGRE